MTRHQRNSLAAYALLFALTACGDAPQRSESVELTLVAYDSFVVDDTPLRTALDDFRASTGHSVTVLNSGDTGTMVNKAVLTSGNPEGDVMWGVDSTFLSAAVEGGVFAGEPVEVDYGDVCINYDIEWFRANNIAPPTTLDDLTEPTYRGLLAVPDPTRSSPGLAFLLATIDFYGDPGWQDYWAELRANDVTVTDSWDTGYFEAFTRSGGAQPLVVSYGSSPPYEVLFADPPRRDAPTAVVAATCVRQVEYAGVLRGTEHSEAAGQLVEFLTSERFQRELPLTLFVYPADRSVQLPTAFTDYTVIPENPLTIDPQAVADNRERWQDEWTNIVLR